MKKRVNLFSQRIDNQTAKKYLLYGERATYGVLLFGVVSLMVLFGTYIYFSRNLADLNSKKSTYSRYILANKTFNQDIQDFVRKFSLLKSFIETDADGFRYYRSLISIVEPIGISDKIESFSINNGQEVTFSFIVPTYDEGLQALAFFERTEVLENFDSLILESFDIPENSADYTMTFNGIMKSIE